MNRILQVILCAGVVSGLSAQGSEWEKRDEWQNVAGILYAMHVDSSSVVADIGCQEGYLTLRMAPRVREVLAVDIDESALSTLRRNAAKLSNVRTVLGTVDNPNLPADSLDAAVIVNAYHEMDSYESMLRYIHTSLKANGRLVIVEPISKSLRGECRKKQIQSHKIDLSYVKDDLTKAGFRILGEQDPFVERRERKDEMWILVAEKPELD